MDGRQRKVLEAARRIQLFLDAHPDAVTIPRPLREAFDKAVADLATYDSVQYVSKGTAKGETAVQKRLRRTIYEDFLSPMRDVAEYRKVNDPALIVDSYIERHGEWEMQVEALANAAEKHQDLLLDYLGRPNFVAELRAALQQLRNSLASRSLLTGNRSGATAGIKAAYIVVRDKIPVLDSTVSRQLRKNPPLLASWKSACRIHKTTIDPRPGGDATPPDDKQKPST